jgi:hypothetical protein
MCLYSLLQGRIFLSGLFWGCELNCKEENGFDQDIIGPLGIDNKFITDYLRDCF